MIACNLIGYIGFSLVNFFANEQTQDLIEKLKDMGFKVVLSKNVYSNTLGYSATIDEKVEDPQEKDLYRVGVIARILKLFDMPDGTKTVINSLNFN